MVALQTINIELAKEKIRTGDLDGAIEADVREAGEAVERLAAVPVEAGFALYEAQRLRMWAVLVRADGDDTAYQNYRDRDRDMATSLGFEGQMKWAEAMR